MPLPIIDNNPPPQKPATGRAVPVEMKTALVQTAFQPRQSLLTMIQGSILIIDLFKQLLGSADASKAQAQELDAPWQQYDLIRDMEVRLQGDFSFAPNEESAGRTVTGEFITYPGVVLNMGDMFRADAGDGRRGIFTVIKATPLSYYKQTCYTVQFQLLATDDARREADLMKKVVETYHFVADFARFGKNPILIDELYNDYRNLFRVSETMISEYLRLYFSEVSQTLMIPGQDIAAYDPFLVKAVLSILETTQHPMLRKVSRHNVDSQYAFRTTTVWDALLQMEPSHLYLACQRCGLAPKGVVSSRASFGGAYWSKIDEIMYPIDEREDVDANRTYNPSIDTQGLHPGPAPLHDFRRLIPVKDTTQIAIVESRDPGDNVPNIHDVTIDDYYVFSEAFYKEDHEKMSHLETMVWSVINQNELDVPKLAELVNQSKRWDKLERFYYIPVLMVLAGLALRGPAI